MPFGVHANTAAQRDADRAEAMPIVSLDLYSHVTETQPFGLPNRVSRAKNSVFGSNLGGNRALEV
jgi:hypothetical protein